MEKLTKGEVIELLDKGYVLKQSLIPDFGTSSMTRPIKRTGREISRFSIDDKRVHHSIGFKLIKTLVLQSTERQGLGRVKTYKKTVV
jgi:hypothetical protein